MSYRERVQCMCDELGIENHPIKEEDLTVDYLSFVVDDEWIDIEGTDMNKAGRLFFQYHVEWDGCVDAVSWCWSEEPTGEVGPMPDFMKKAPAHFGEMWNDAEEKGRTLITAMKHAECVIINWKV